MTRVLANVARPLLLLMLAVSVTACGLIGEDDEGQGAATLDEALQAHAEGRIDEAVELYKEVIAVDPENQYAWYNLGLIHQQRGSANLAEDEYRKALEIDPGFVPAMFNLAILLSGIGETDEAVELYRGVIALEPDNASAHLNLGFLLLDTGQRKEGRAELGQAVALDPTLASRIPEEIAADLESLAGVSATPTVTPTA
jgi:tetratricopeptide (TPR) repeat protein